MFLKHWAEYNGNEESEKEHKEIINARDVHS
jgi:hypothetical protein